MTAFALARESSRRHAARSIGRFLAIAACVLLPGTAQLALAQSTAYPSRPIRFLVPFAAGGGADIIARQVGKAIEPILGQPVVIENKPGANGMIGSELGARAAPDGYTVLVGSIGTHGTNQYLYPKLAYDPAKDFVPVTLMTKTNNVLVVPAGSPIKSLQELITAARQKPGTLNSGIPAIGDTAHLAFEKFRRDANIEVVGVPYNSVNGAVSDLLGGRLDFMFASIVTQNPQIQAGKLRPLVTTDATRSPVLPNVPTLSESGFPGFVATGWIGLFVPAGTPNEIVEQLSAAVRKAYQSPEFMQVLRAGGDPIASTPKEFNDLIIADRAKWSKVIQDANVKLEQ
jgi:tripartite-type tricarboxylate transporter receptor subunit TctC